jgi:hypothetical protein
MVHLPAKWRLFGQLELIQIAYCSHLSKFLSDFFIAVIYKKVFCEVWNLSIKVCLLYFNLY